MLEPVQNNYFSFAAREVSKSKNKELKELFGSGIGIHHAGMLRSDRRLAESLFQKEVLKASIIRMQISGSFIFIVLLEPTVMATYVRSLPCRSCAAHPLLLGELICQHMQL